MYVYCISCAFNQPSDSPPHQSPTPLRVVSDPRRKISKEGSLKEGGGAEGKKVQVEDVLESPHGEPSVVSFKVEEWLLP